MKLQRIYDQVPEAGCKGLCTEACGIILPQLGAEQARFDTAHRLHGLASGWRGDGSCNALIAGRCAVYADRPLICRLYGVAQGLLCAHGCQPVALVTRRRAEKLRGLVFQAVADTGGKADPE